MFFVEDFPARIPLGLVGLILVNFKKGMAQTDLLT
jgi:hypothetical protein